MSDTITVLKAELLDLQIKYNTLADSTRYMREQQKAYFKSRDKVVLAESKRAEKAVDNLVQNNNQLNLI